MKCAVIGGTVALVAIALATTAMLLRPRTEFTDRSGHRDSLVTVAPDVRIEVLDWGGSGPSLILLPGLGNTAHVFDHFAHQFTDRYHVLGITRRGYGDSTHAPSGYDVATRARDILTVSDRMELGQVILVGHSIAGDEMTRFAATYPNRVGALVYVEAAYNRTKVDLKLPQPEFPKPSSDVHSSVEQFNAYSARIWNWRFPEAETYNAMSVIVATGAARRELHSVASRQREMPKARSLVGTLSRRGCCHWIGH
jgi:pimeloyl-ACP methyl ester carboxylesterase